MNKNKIDEIVKSSPDIVTALESIAPMYGIPADHILEDAKITSIKVVGDNIIAPADVKPNTKSIICAIGSVLDYISQRIDSKVSDYQTTAITKGHIEDHMKRDANPSKGKVIARYVDSNGDEIIAYDSGLVDMAHTPEAIAKVNELRQNMQIPMYNPKAMSTKTSYFTDEDDISVEEPRSEKFTESMVLNMASDMNESMVIMDKIAHYHDTTHLGYDWMQEMGYEFIKPTDAFIQESKKEKIVKPGDIKHMKFDNSHILKAIKYFNEARAKQPEAGKGQWDVHSFINTPEYNNAIKELEQQFDCKLNVRWFKQADQEGTMLYTTLYPEQIKQNLHVSKSKGFQLNGLPIEVFVINEALDEEMTKDTSMKLFGQFVCASICHEIFHNIAMAVRYANAEFTFTLSSALSLAASTPNAKNRRIVFEKFTNTLSANGVKLNIIQKKKLVKELCYITALAYNERALSEIKGKLEKVEQSDAAVKEIDQYISLLEKLNKKLTTLEKQHDRVTKHPVANGLLYAVGVLLTLTIIGGIIGIPIMALTMDPMPDYEKYKKSTNKEEYYCDLFAASYNLPLSFTYGVTIRDYSANQISKEQLNKMAMLEMNISKLIQSTYPSISERNYAAMTCAKKILDSGEKIDPSIKAYCEWVVANYSSIMDTEISEKHQTVTFDPKEAEDLDKHLQNIITNNNIKVTESYIGKFRDVIVSEMSDDTLQNEIYNLSLLNDHYTKQLQLITRPHMYQEGKLGDAWDQFKDDVKQPVRGNDDEHLIKKILLFIPRVLNAIIQSIARLFNKNDVSSLVNDMRDMQKQIDKLSKSNQKYDANIKTIARHILILNNKINNGIDIEDARYAEVKKCINDMYVDIKKLGIVKADKANQTEQARTVLTLAGYVLYTFDLNAYKTFMNEFDDVLSKMDNITADTVSGITDFSKFNISNTNIELDKHKGHFVYSIDDFEKYTKEIDTLNHDVTKHCQKLIKQFNEMNRKIKFGKNNSTKSSALKNIQEFSNRLTNIMKKLSNTRTWYTEDFNKIRASINSTRGCITKLAHYNSTSYTVLHNTFGDAIEVDNLDKHWVKEFWNAHSDERTTGLFIFRVNRENMKKFFNITKKAELSMKLAGIDYGTVQNIIIAHFMDPDHVASKSNTFLIHYNTIDKNFESLIDKELSGSLIIEK